jgi:hypothetical protein
MCALIAVTEVIGYGLTIVDRFPARLVIFSRLFLGPNIRHHGLFSRCKVAQACT